MALVPSLSWADEKFVTHRHGIPRLRQTYHNNVISCVTSNVIIIVIDIVIIFININIIITKKLI